MSKASYFVTLFAALALVLHSEHVFSEPINVTVDDTNGDPRTGNQFVYFPSSNAWNLGQSCGSACWAKVNASLAYMNTWHDVTWVSFIVWHSIFCTIILLPVCQGFFNQRTVAIPRKCRLCVRNP